MVSLLKVVCHLIEWVYPVNKRGHILLILQMPLYTHHVVEGPNVEITLLALRSKPI